jgi:hypothetical protein
MTYEEKEALYLEFKQRMFNEFGDLIQEKLMPFTVIELDELGEERTLTGNAGKDVQALGEELRNV